MYTSEITFLRSVEGILDCKGRGLRTSWKIKVQLLQSEMTLFNLNGENN